MRGDKHRIREQLKRVRKEAKRKMLRERAQQKNTSREEANRMNSS